MEDQANVVSAYSRWRGTFSSRIMKDEEQSENRMLPVYFVHVSVRSLQMVGAWSVVTWTSHMQYRATSGNQIAKQEITQEGFSSRQVDEDWTGAFCRGKSIPEKPG